MGDTKPSQLANKFILLDLIGVGGMAEVYRCKLSGQKGFEKIVVLKKLLPQVAQDAVVVENFIDEAKLAALLQHENIVHIYDFGELDGSYFIAMEYLFGKDLYSILQQARETGKPIGVETCLLIASKICEGMEYAHNLKDLQQRPLNIIHRDLSPHNVFVTYDGKIKIIDFGIAKAELFDNRTKSGVIKGKISYMSPEQLSEKEIDLRSDIFSIGILLHEMLSGQRLFTGDTATLIRKCMQAEYEQLEKINPGLFPGIYQIVNRALQKDRTKRYQTCAEMREDIEDCLFAMGKRPNTQVLKEYVLQLFEQSYENEKKKLIATIERADGGHNPGKLGTNWDGSSLPFFSGSEERTAVMDKDDRTLFLNVADITGNQPTPFYREIVSALANPPGRIFLTGIFLYIIAVPLLFIHPSSLQVERHVEGVETVEFAWLPQHETTEDEEVQSSQQLQQVPFITKEQEKRITPHQLEINALLDKADTAFRYKRLTVPEGDSAFIYYKKVLDIAPHNDAAHEGLQQIAEKYADYAERDLAGKNVIAAQKNIRKGLEVSPQSVRLSGLLTRAELEKRALIKELERKAQTSIENNDLTSPLNDCAYKYYQEIKRLDHDSALVKNGIGKIADKYAELADGAYRNLKLTNAREYVKKGLQVQPDHDRLLDIQQDLSRSKPGIFFKMLEKNVRTAIESK
ncbi:MAG: protein kinase [Desulforhopalus sp.]